MQSLFGNNGVRNDAYSTIHKLAQDRTMLGNLFDSHLMNQVRCVLEKVQHVRITNSTAIRLNCCMGVFHFNILMAHQCPSRKVGPIKLGSPPEVFDGLLVFRAEGIMIA